LKSYEKQLLLITHSLSTVVSVLQHITNVAGTH